MYIPCRNSWAFCGIIKDEMEESAMRTLRRRVVIASAMPDEVQNLRAALEKAGFSETVCVSDGISALHETAEAG